MRIAGFDTRYFNSIENPDLTALARKEKRIILTRDTRLAKTDAITVLLIREDALNDQLVRVFHSFGLRIEEKNIFTRCIICNKSLVPVDRETVRNEVPPFIYTARNRFSYCTVCGRIYWRGTHFANSLKRFQDLNVIKQG